MSLTYLQARNEMFKMFADAWALNTPAIVSPAPTVYYPNVLPPSPPPSNLYFAVVNIKVAKEVQKTLAIDVVNFGGRMYNNKGLFICEIMCPLSDAPNSEKGAELATVARNAFRGKRSPCGVVFYDAMFTVSKSTEVFSKYIMTVEYNYDDIT